MTICIYCHSSQLLKQGKRDGHQVFYCYECDRTFVEGVTPAPLFTPPPKDARLYYWQER